MDKQTPRLVCSKKKSIIHVVVQITHLSKIFTDLNFYRIKQGKYVFFKQWWNSFYAIKTSARETEARELDSFALIILLFHVELLSVNSLYCMVLLLSAPSYNLFYRSCGVRLEILLVLPTAYISTEESTMFFLPFYSADCFH